MKTILFEGDSITDVFRTKESDAYLGSGYATMTAGRISVDYPGQYQMINRGLSGNRSVDLYAAIKSDVINLKPDILTVLIGVNDVFHEIRSQNGVSPEKYEKVLSMFVEEVIEALPGIQIVLMEPFVLEGTVTSESFDRYNNLVKRNAQACRRVAQQYGLRFVPLQEKLDALAEITSNRYVSDDGIHPSYAGHEIISRELYTTLKGFL